jgi:hypothetical protein
VFKRLDGMWSQQGRVLTGAGEQGAASFGYSVALSASGDVALVGGPTDRYVRFPNGISGYGAAWVFARSGGVWVQDGPKLTGRAEPAYADFGLTVTLAGDGRTALISSSNLSRGRGGAWFFVDDGGRWVQQAELVGPPTEIGLGGFGGAVALSYDGDTAAIGCGDDNHERGALWFYTRSGGIWRKQGGKITGGGESGTGVFGVAVGLSADGSTALVGGYGDDAIRGAVWVFRRRLGVWRQVGAKFTANAPKGAGFGGSVALSENGTIGLSGAMSVDHNRGAAWVFPLPIR